MGQFVLTMQLGQKESTQGFTVDMTQSQAGTKTKSKSSDTYKYEEFKNLY